MEVYTNKITSKLPKLYYLIFCKNYKKFENIYKIALKIVYLKKIINFFNQNFLIKLLEIFILQNFTQFIIKLFINLNIKTIK